MSDLSFWCDNTLGDEDRALAERLALPVVDGEQSGGLYLARRDGRLVLGRFGSAEKPICVDFTSAAQLGRRQRGKELLVKAVGGGVPRPSVLDATAGLGRDAFILASHGYPVTLVEREPVLVALLEDGVRRALYDPALVEIAARMQLVAADALDYLQALSGAAPDVIYLDPMFADSGKAARVKKDLRLLQELLAARDDGDALLARALASARYRVVVKRAIKAAPLAGPAPSFAIKGKAIRFDVYALRSFDRRD